MCRRARPRDGTPAGLYVDLGRLVADDLGLPLRVRWIPRRELAHRWLDAHEVPMWVRFRTEPDIIDAVVRGDADAGVVSDVAAGWYRQQSGAASLRVPDTLLDPDEFGFDVAIVLLDTDAATLAPLQC